MADCRLNQLKLQIKLCSKAKVGLVYIKALLEHYTKYCGLRKHPQVTRTRARGSEEGLLHRSAEELKVPSGSSWKSAKGGPCCKKPAS